MLKENCPDDPDKIAPGICGCGIPDTDTNGDNIVDCGNSRWINEKTIPKFGSVSSNQRTIILGLERFAGESLRYRIFVTGPGANSRTKVYTSSSPNKKISSLKRGKYSIRYQVTTSAAGRKLQSALSTTVKITVS